MDLSDVVASTSSGTGMVHGVLVGQVSPIKTSRKRANVKYFEGQLSDGKKTVRLVSFDPNLHRKFEEAQKSQCSVALQNCIFKRSRPDSDDMEILVNKKSSITQSPKKFKVGKDDSLLKCVLHN